MSTESHQYVLWETGASWLKIAGDDCMSWLQGQVANDLRELKSKPCQTIMTTSTGRVLAHAYLMSANDEIIAITHQPDEFRTRIKQCVVAEDVVIYPLAGKALSITGPGSRQFLTENCLSGFPTDRLGSSDHDFLVPEVAQDWTIYSQSQMLPTLFKFGWPLIGRDTTSKTLPAELPRSYFDKTISMSKGCYTGQEIIQRMETRGHANWTWVALVADQDIPCVDTYNSEGRHVVQVLHCCRPEPGGKFVASAYVAPEFAVDGIPINVEGKTCYVRNLPLN